MKILAFYLPQFHEIPENNNAWGKGFTEWVNVKKAKKYYEWQRQPRVPFNENYYDLLDTKAMRKQCELAKEYKIDGFCIYHYWFNGRMVLEKPVKNLLENKDIDIEYCFAWANEPWTKTWHGAGGNREILIPQEYGQCNDWDMHYQYFKDYFEDDRYIKIQKKPVVLVYRLRNIPEFNQMIKYWNKCACDDGFDGIYIVSMNFDEDAVSKSINVNACVDFEPNYTKKRIYGNQSLSNDDPIVMDYDLLINELLEKEHEHNHFRTVFVDYDDTPRRGSRGICTRNTSPDKFMKCFEKSLHKSKAEGNDLIFINAWNEWGEGNYLEPDTDNGFAYLETIREVVEKNK